MRKTKILRALDIKNLKTPGRYADGGGLYLQISKWGTKSWVFRYSKDGNAHHMGLGDINTFTLKEARERATTQRKLLADKIDPLAERKKAQIEKKIADAHSITFADATAEYIKAHSVKWGNAKHAAQWKSTLTKHAFPVFGDLPVDKIDTTLVLKCLKPIWTKTPETASRLRGRIEAVLGWAGANDCRSGPNPARWQNHLSALLPAKSKLAPVKHHEAMPYQNIGSFIVRLHANSSIAAIALEVLILTATRTSEVVAARWDEFDLEQKTWTIPASRYKTGRELRIPLANWALRLLKKLPRQHGNPYVFPGVRPGRPISDRTMLDLLKATKGNGYTCHGFRASFRNWCAEQTNYPREVCEQALGHIVENKVERAYRRTDLFEKRRRLMQNWEAYLSRPQVRGEVVPLRERA